MGRTSPSYNKDKPFADGTLLSKFKHNFTVGRTTSTECSWASDRLPDPEKSCDTLESVFIKHLFNGREDAWKLTAAISGAHTLGRAQVSRSGYDGFWSDIPNSGIFNNDYFKSLLFKGWAPELAVAGNSERNQWQRIDKGKNAAVKEMMLNTDMCLAYDNNKPLGTCIAGSKGRRRS